MLIEAYLIYMLSSKSGGARINVIEGGSPSRPAKTLGLRLGHGLRFLFFFFQSRFLFLGTSLVHFFPPTQNKH